MKAQRMRVLPAVPGVLFPLFAVMLAAAILFPGCLGSGSIREKPPSPGAEVPLRKAGYTPGIYEGIGRGYRGPVHVQVQLSPAGIEDIVITGHRESAYPGVAAMEELLEAVLETGSTDLDVVSGASFSSRGFLEAVEDAMGQAHGQAHGQARY